MKTVKFGAAESKGKMAFYLLSLFTCFFFASLLLPARCQQSTPGSRQYTLLYTIPVQAGVFATDKLQQTYVLTLGNEVIKYTADGQLQFTYPNKTLGDAAGIDATNPFHLLLFFPAHQTVLTLDRTLNLSGQFNLLQFGLLRVGAVGMGSDGRLWVYDEADFQLRKIESDGQVITRSNDLSLILGKPVRPVFLIEQNQQVYLSDPELGILIFDIFGQYQKTLPLKNLRSFQVFDDQLVYFADGELRCFHLRALLDVSIELPEGVQPGDQINMQKDRLFVLNKQGINIYKF